MRFFYSLARFSSCLEQHRRPGGPCRGYLDAVNMHPVEQALRYLGFASGLLAAKHTFGLHVGSALTALLAWTLLDLLHHMPFNAEVHLPMLYPAYARDHQMHHRKRRCNYGTTSSLLDRLLGTFQAFCP